MGWKECNKMDEKLKFIARYLEREKIASLCRDFGVSRATGHNLIKRYKMMGQQALVRAVLIEDFSKSPFVCC